MKRILIIVGLISILLLPLILFACASNAQASLGQEFTLPVGKTTEIIDESLSIKFIEVTADSRCPTGVQCFWAGEAKCMMEITLNGAVSEKTFTISANNTPGTFDQYSFALKLEPYPEAGKDIAPWDYRLIMTVTK